jgi:hypothetical protein
LSVSWELNPARVKASERGAKCYPLGCYFSLNILKIFVYIRITDTPSSGVVVSPDWFGETFLGSSLNLSK